MVKITMVLIGYRAGGGVETLRHRGSPSISVKFSECSAQLGNFDAVCLPSVKFFECSAQLGNFDAVCLPSVKFSECSAQLGNFDAVCLRSVEPLQVVLQVLTNLQSEHIESSSLLQLLRYDKCFELLPLSKDHRGPQYRGGQGQQIADDRDMIS